MVINTLIFYRFDGPDLRIEIFFNKEKVATEEGEGNFEIGDAAPAARLYWELKKI